MTSLFKCVCEREGWVGACHSVIVEVSGQPYLHLLGTVSLLFPHWVYQACSLHFQGFSCLHLPFPCWSPKCWGFELTSSCLCGKHFDLPSHLSLSSLSAADSACRLALVHPAPDSISFFLSGLTLMSSWDGQPDLLPATEQDLQSRFADWPVRV